MRGANVVRKRSVTNPGDPAGAAGAVSGGPADREGSVPLAGGSAAGDGSDAVGGRDAASMGPQPVIGPAASGGQTPVVVAQPQPGAPLPADTVGTTHLHPRRPGPARSRFALRNWRVRWRLAALIAVPLLTAAVLGALTISRDVSNWQTTGRVQHLAQLNSAVVKYIQAVEDERDYSVASTANRAWLFCQAEDRTACHRWRRRTGHRLGRWHHGRRRLSARRGAGGERGTSGRGNPSARPQDGGRPGIPHDGDHAGVHRERHPAREHIHQRRRERGQQYRSPARRHRPRRAAPGRRRQVGSAGPPAEGGQFPAADAVARRRLPASSRHTSRKWRIWPTSTHP